MGQTQEKMSSSKQVRKEVEKQIKNCTIKKQNVKKFFKLMERQQKKYQILEFAGNGSFALVLKAINKNTGQKVALKVVECDENDQKGIQAIQQEYKILEVFTGCKYIVKVFNHFYLTESSDSDSDEDDNQIPVGKNKNQSSLMRVFYVMEQELCQSNMLQQIAIYSFQILTHFKMIAINAKETYFLINFHFACQLNEKIQI